MPSTGKILSLRIRALGVFWEKWGLGFRVFIGLGVQGFRGLGFRGLGFSKP